MMHAKQCYKGAHVGREVMRMKRLLTLTLAVLLSVGIASVSWAADEPAGGSAPAGDTGAKAPKKHKKHGKKHHKKSKTPAAAPAK